MKIFTCLAFWLTSFALCAQQIVINEIVSSNSSVNTDEDGSYQDWVELYNNGTAAVNLNGYGLSDDTVLPFKWTFPAVTVNPGGFLLVFCSDKNRAVAGQLLHTNFKISSSGEIITLTAPGGTTADQIPATAIATNQSYGRYTDGTSNFEFFSIPTPAAPNNNGTASLPLDPPTFSQVSGFYSAGFNLTLNAAPNVTILYTLDGSEPDENNLGGTTYQYQNQYQEHPADVPGPLLDNSFTTLTYSAPISIANRTPQPNKLSAISSTYHFDPGFYLPDNPVYKGTVVRAKAVRPGFESSPVVSRSYFVFPAGSNQFSFPVVSLSFNEDRFFGYDDGIYVAGADFDAWRAANPTLLPGSLRVGNYYRKGSATEQKANMSYFVNGAEVINQDVGLRIRGASSRKYEMKSLTVYARSEFGDGNLSYSFFPDLTDDNFERLTLSNSGSDFRNTMFRDPLAQRICRELHVENENYQPTMVFFNGEFWGISSMRERYDDEYFDRVYGFEDVDLLENEGLAENDEVEEGDDEHYQAMMAYLQTHSLASDAHYDYIKTQLDPESFTDFEIANIFLQNHDWPGNNVQYWRKKTDAYIPDAPYGEDGRWRWLLHDMDDSFSFGTDNFNGNTLQIATSVNNNGVNPEWSTRILRRLLENASYKNDFINRFADLLNTSFLPSRTVALLNGMNNVVAPEMPKQIERWSSPANMGDYNFFTNYETNFLNARPAFQRNHIRNKFGIAANINATLEVSDAAHGWIKMNTIDIKQGTPGITASNPYPWTGIYFSNIPVKIKATAHPGYVFSHWEGFSTSTDAEITITPPASYTLKAVFVPDGFAIEQEVPIYFWWMSGAIPNDTPLLALNSSYEITNDAQIAFQSALAGYPFDATHPNWRKASMERRNKPTPINYRPEANNGLPYVAGDMKALQITQPFQANGLQNTMVFETSTANYHKIKFSFAAMDEGAATAILVDYATNPGTPVWTTMGLSDPSLPLVTDVFQLSQIDFSAVAAASNNTNFKIRLRFTGPDMTASLGKRVTFNNIALDGVRLPLIYPSPLVLTVGTPITPIVPELAATATVFTVAPALPAGLSLDATTGVISGTPTVVSAATAYTVTATNSGGSVSFDLSITVNDTAPAALSYPTPNVLTVNTSVVNLAPTVSGNVSAFAIAPALPAGLSLDAATGVISGTPTVVSAATAYTVTANNSGGSVSFDLSITVNDTAPAALSYPTPNVLTVNTSVVNLAPTVSGNVSAFAIAPALPAGLGLDAATGVISGTPTAVSSATAYTVTATNSGGSVSFDLSITVNDIAPAALSYPTPNVFTVNTPVVNLAPTVNGNVSGFTIAPALPAGLGLDAATGVISGTPTVVSAATAYTVTATNSGGSVSFDLSITVNDTAPAALSYPTPNVFTVNTPVVNLAPTVNGNVSGFTIAPALPAGLGLDAATGVISGTPTVVSAATIYTVTATNSGGSVSFDLSITVNDTAPAALSYPTPNVFTVNTSVVNLAPTVNGNISAFAIVPGLPAGLSLDSATGVISGTPTVVSSATAYTVTATNSGGSVSFDLSITVNDTAPAALSYPTPNVFTVNSSVVNLAPTVGGDVSGFTIAPALPAGLGLDAATGVISGTPTIVSAATAYTVTATNSGGSVSFDLSITVNDTAPAALSYPTPNVLTVNSSVVNLAPTVNGNISAFAIAPALPAGLGLDAATGVISGTPTIVSAATTYTVTATNSGGSVSFGLSITVNDTAPAALSYPTPNVFTVNSSVVNLAPTVSGNVSGFTIAPALPAGLGLDAATGVISGTPTVVSSATAYTVTATNSGGSVSFGLSIAIVEPAPLALSYDNPNVFVVGNTIADLTPTVSGPVSLYTVAPDLPDGLFIDPMTGNISGTPNAVSAATIYTVTATNSGGSVSFDLTITVEELLAAQTFAASDVTVYPNPFTDRIHIKGNFMPTRYRLIGMDGSVIRAGWLREEYLAFPDLPNGVYVLQLSFEKQTQQIKVIKRM